MSSKEAIEINAASKSRLEALVGNGAAAQGQRLSADEAAAKSCTMQTLANRLGRTTISTCFSGVDTPATAHMTLLWAASKELSATQDDANPDDEFAFASRGGRGGHGETHEPHEQPSLNLFAVEILEKCQSELQVHPGGPKHIYKNMKEFFIPGVRSRVDSLIAQGLVHSVLVPLVQEGKTCAKSAYCLIHGRHCEAEPWSQVLVLLLQCNSNS